MRDIAAGPLLLQGDCMELLSTLPEHSVDFVLVDLPYGITDAEWDKELPLDKVWGAIDRVASPEAPVVMFASNKFVYKVVNSNFKALKYKYIWVKNAPSNFLNSGFMPMPIFEEILVFIRAPVKKTYYSPQMLMGFEPYERKAGRVEVSSTLWNTKTRLDHKSTGSRFPRNVLFYNVVRGKTRLHPTQKPVDLLQFLIRTYCRPGGTVLDFCMGSGSTGVAAVSAGRRFIGIEKDPGYFELASNAVNSAYSSTVLQ